MSKGRVYWISGLSNSGKTTLGTALYYELKKTNNVVILDGDLMKEIASGNSSVSYDIKDRFLRAERYSKLAKLLSDQGIWVIVCAIAMFDQIRDWNRNNIKGYVEIFIDAPVEVLKKRDKKGLFKGIDDSIQFPKSPDITFYNDGINSLRDAVKKIKDFVPKNEEDFDRDREYWNHFYSNIERTGKLAEPSQFATDIVKDLVPGNHLLELGCGNGRDSLFFLKKGLRVTALDASDIAVDFLNSLTLDNDNALFVCDNFVKCQSLYQLKYDYIYSRFTLHAINEEQENELLANIHDALSLEGILYIEARTTKDEIYGKGKEVERNAYIYNGHYRRFINPIEFRVKLENLGFEILSIEERNGFSKTETSDPVLMRCIAKLR